MLSVLTATASSLNLCYYIYKRQKITSIITCFNMSLSLLVIDRISRLKNSKNMKELKNTNKEHKLLETLHYNSRNHIFFSSAPGTFNKLELL